jgi:hypothetical protein
VTISLAIYLLGLGIQILIWPLLYFFSIVHYRRLLRRRRAKGLRHAATYSQLVIVAAVLSLMLWTLFFVLPKVRQLGTKGSLTAAIGSFSANRRKKPDKHCQAHKIPVGTTIATFPKESLV